ncbi:copper-binding protein [Sedimenticola sp.]|uniref:copper-binding protein n=1 Tax=Sedimenticola sp. TaxID=1940285 RepID=UPI002589AE8F|nr:copper-binding protein [Sedimenticola sp.]MCW8904643.1 copper-binding protein [Sedimenticola sp.]
MKKALPMFALLTSLFSLSAQAAGYLATKPEALPDLVFGTDEAGYQVSQSSYELETGKSYRLKIVSSGRKEYALRAPEFFTFIWLRKIEAGGMEIKASALYELEFEEEGEAEIFFVPIKPGKYTVGAAGLEQKGSVAEILVN